MKKMFEHWVAWLLIDLTMVYTLWMVFLTVEHVMDRHYLFASVTALMGYFGLRGLRRQYTDLAVDYPNEAVWPEYHTDPKVVEFIDGAAGIIRDQLDP